MGRRYRTKPEETSYLLTVTTDHAGSTASIFRKTPHPQTSGTVYTTPLVKTAGEAAKLAHDYAADNGLEPLQSIKRKPARKR